MRRGLLQRYSRADPVVLECGIVPGANPAAVREINQDANIATHLPIPAPHHCSEGVPASQGPPSRPGSAAVAKAVAVPGGGVGAALVTGERRQPPVENAPHPRCRWSDPVDPADVAAAPRFSPFVAPASAPHPVPPCIRCPHWLPPDDRHSPAHRPPQKRPQRWLPSPCRHVRHE